MINQFFTPFDIVFFLTIGAGLTFGVFLLSSKSRLGVRDLSLGLFLIIQALIGIDAIVSFSPSLKFKLLNISPYLSYSFGLFSWLEGPLLLIYTKSFLFDTEKFDKKDFLHFLPAVLYFLFLYIIYFRFPPDVMLSMQQSPDLLVKWSMANYLLFCQKIIYGIICVKFIYRYASLATSQAAYCFYEQICWAKILVFGYIVTRTILLIYFIMYLFVPPIPGGEDVNEYIQHILIVGFLGFFLWMVILYALVYFALNIADQITPIVNMEGDFDENNKKQDVLFSQDDIDKITLSRSNKDIFLKSNLQLRRYAEYIGLSPRVASAVINKHFNTNFSEFVNNVRIEFAKNALIDNEFKHATILDICLASGFNSKSVFNRVFKATYGTTPTEFRKMHLNT